MWPFGLSKKQRELCERIGKMTVLERREYSKNLEKESAQSLGLGIEEYKALRIKQNVSLVKYHDQIDSGKPSSKLGQELYWKEVGILGLPFAIMDAFSLWFKGSSVWYADDGFRSVTHRHKSIWF